MHNCEQKKLKPQSREVLGTIAGGEVERRGAVRFQLQAAVLLEWIDFSGAKQKGVGRTRDVSIFGAFVTCGVKPPSGTFVSLEVQLPPLERNTLQRLQLKASGKVTRSSEDGEGVGIALSARFSLEEGIPAASLAGLP